MMRMMFMKMMNGMGGGAIEEKKAECAGIAIAGAVTVECAVDSGASRHCMDASNCVDPHKGEGISLRTANGPVTTQTRQKFAMHSVIKGVC